MLDKLSVAFLIRLSIFEIPLNSPNFKYCLMSVHLIFDII